MHNHVGTSSLFRAKIASAYYAHQTHIQILKELIQARRLNFWLKKPDVSTVKKTPNGTRVWSLLRGYRYHTSASHLSGGASRDRTDDIQLAKLALSQLSYGPVFTPSPSLVVGLTRLELVTPRLSSVCSNQLSYRPSDTSSKNNLLWILTSHQSFVKEVIQPQVPQRLPCYDFTPVISPTVVAPSLAVRVTASD